MGVIKWYKKKRDVAKNGRNIFRQTVRKFKCLNLKPNYTIRPRVFIFVQIYFVRWKEYRILWKSDSCMKRRRNKHSIKHSESRNFFKTSAAYWTWVEADKRIELSWRSHSDMVSVRLSFMCITRNNSLSESTFELKVDGLSLVAVRKLGAWDRSSHC